jgi:hypothetical protein
MLLRLLAACLLVVLAARPSLGQLPPAPPPNAGTQVRCCTDWTVKVVHGWPLPNDGPPRVAFTFPDGWPVITIVATPEAPSGNVYVYTVPGKAARMFVWDPAEQFSMAGVWRSPIQSLREWRFETSAPNALGALFYGGGIAEVYHANYLPDVVKLYVVTEDGTRSRDLKVRIR